MCIIIYIVTRIIISNQIDFAESGKKEAKKKIHEEVIAEDYDNAREDINQIDISQKFMVYVITN